MASRERGSGRTALVPWFRMSRCAPRGVCPKRSFRRLAVVVLRVAHSLHERSGGAEVRRRTEHGLLHVWRVPQVERAEDLPDPGHLRSDDGHEHGRVAVMSGMSGFGKIGGFGPACLKDRPIVRGDHDRAALAATRRDRTATVEGASRSPDLVRSGRLHERMIRLGASWCDVWNSTGPLVHARCVTKGLASG